MRSLRLGVAGGCAAAPELRVLVDRRNAALNALHRQPKSAATRALLNDARAASKAGVSAAKSAWIEEQCKPGDLQDLMYDILRQTVKKETETNYPGNPEPLDPAYQRN